MPRYDYAPVSGRCNRCDGRFEVMQRVAERKLKRCPTCGKAVERLISAPALGGKYSITPKKIQDLGMTQYKKAGDGVYERTAGTKGPKVMIKGQPNVKADDF
jgi:putative FmdB family regulatory protein